MTAVDAGVSAGTDPATGDHDGRFVLGGVPFDYHGPVDFPCYGCALRSLAEYHGVRVSRNRLMFEGTFRFSYAYRRDEGFFTNVRSWIDAGFFESFKGWYRHGAAVAGVDIRFLDTSPADRWDDVWNTWKSTLRQGEPIYLSIRNAGILWRGAGLPAPAEGPGHVMVLLGYDEARNVAVCHDNWWWSEHTDGGDKPIVEYRLADLQESFSNPKNVPPFVVTGPAHDRSRPSVRELIATQSEIMLGTRVHQAFHPPEADDFATGYHALLAAGNDLADKNTAEDANRLLAGFERFLNTGWWMGVEGQPARAAWLSGVAAVTRNSDVDLAASYIDDVASALALARRAYRDYRSAAGESFALTSPLLAEIARQFAIAGQAEQRAGEALDRASDEL